MKNTRARIKNTRARTPTNTNGTEKIKTGTRKPRTTPDNPPERKKVTFGPTNIKIIPRRKENQESKTKPTTRPRIRKNKQLTIVTVNVRGIKSKIMSMESLLTATKADVALITETKLEKKPTNQHQRIQMDSKKQKQKRRWGRNPNKKHNLPTSKRRQHSRRTPRPGNQVDNTRNQTKKHSNRSLLRTPRKRKNRESNRNIQKPGNPNPTETEETRNHTRRRLQRKVKDRPTNDTTKRIKKRRDTRKTTPQDRTRPHKHQRRPRKMYQGKQKETRRKIYHRLHSHIKRDRETISNYSGWRGTVQSQGEKRDWPQHHHNHSNNQPTKKKNIYRKMEPC